MQKHFWKNKTILVTGSSGFTGLHLVSRLRSQGATVVGVSRSPKNNDIKIDVKNKSQFIGIVKKLKPFAIFHLAGDALVEEGKKRPYETTRNNILAALNVLEVSRMYSVHRIIIASTVHVYGTQAREFHEDDPPRPSRPYETSKACVDIIAQSYADTYRLPVLIPRFVNIYGPGDLNVARVIPKTIISLLHNKAPTLWGGAADREYLFIDDVIAAYESLAQITDAQIERNRIYNFGSREHIEVRSLIQKIILISQKNVSIQIMKNGREDEAVKQNISWEKARRVLNWEPHTRIDEGLKKTYLWYQHYFHLP